MRDSYKRMRLEKSARMPRERSVQTSRQTRVTVYYVKRMREKKAGGVEQGTNQCL